MFDVITRLPFGFVLKLNSETSYYSENEFEVKINDTFYQKFNTNIFAIYGLKPNQTYKIEISYNQQKYQRDEKTCKLSYFIDVCDYNAIGNGLVDDSAAINAAIYNAPKGAVVYFKKGEYVVSGIFLKSNVDLYFEKGAIIKQITNREHLAIVKGYQKDYAYESAMVNASWEGNPLDTYISVINGYEVHNVRIYGEGIIDGSGKEGGWWHNPKVKQKAYRPKNWFLNKCQNIEIISLTSRNSASWNIHPYYCDHVSIYDVKLESDKNSPNTDGINPESCKDVRIRGCHFNVGDDCIALKSGKYFMSTFKPRACENIWVDNCFMGDGHGGIAIGSEISCGVKNVLVENCFMQGSDRGIRMKTRRGRGKLSVVENIKIRNIVMQDITHVFAINMYYNCDPDGHSEYVKAKNITTCDAYTPTIKDIEICNVRATNIKGCGIFIYGLSENKVNHIEIKDSIFTFNITNNVEQPEMLDDFDTIDNLGIYINNIENMRIENTTFNGEYNQVIKEEIKWIK